MTDLPFVVDIDRKLRPVKRARNSTDRTGPLICKDGRVIVMRNVTVAWIASDYEGSGWAGTVN